MFPTSYHCARTAGVGPAPPVTVIGDGAVGLCAVLSAKRLGAERIILMGRHKDRTDLGLEFGATDIVSERGEEGIEKARELTGGDGTHTVLECVGLVEAIETALVSSATVGRSAGSAPPSTTTCPCRSRCSCAMSPSPAAWPRPGPISTTCSQTYSRAN